MKKNNKNKFKKTSIRIKWMIQVALTLFISIASSEIARFILFHQVKNSILVSSIASDAVGLIVVAIGLLLIFKSIYKTLKDVEKALLQTSSGFLQTTLPMETKDEWGRMANSLNYSNSRFRDFVIGVKGFVKKQEKGYKQLLDFSTHNHEHLQTATEATNSMKDQIQQQSRHMKVGQAKSQKWAEQLHELMDSCRSMERTISSANKELSHAHMNQKQAERFMNELQSFIDQLRAGIELFEACSSQTQSEAEALRSFVEEILFLSMNGFIEAVKGGQQQDTHLILEQIQTNANDCRKATFSMEEQAKKMNSIQSQLKQVANKTESALNEQKPIIKKTQTSLNSIEEWLKKGLTGLEKEYTLLKMAEEDSNVLTNIFVELFSTEKELSTYSATLVESLEKQTNLLTQPVELAEEIKESYDSLHKELRRYIV